MTEETCPPLVGVGVEQTAARLIRAVSVTASHFRAVGVEPGPKPRARFYQDGRMTFQCGWCGEFDEPEKLRLGILTGNNWPIHPACYAEWYDGGEP